MIFLYKKGDMIKHYRCSLYFIILADKTMNNVEVKVLNSFNLFKKNEILIVSKSVLNDFYIPITSIPIEFLDEIIKIVNI